MSSKFEYFVETDIDGNGGLRPAVVKRLNGGAHAVITGDCTKEEAQIIAKALNEAGH